MIERLVSCGFVTPAAFMSAYRRLAPDPTWRQHLLNAALAQFDGAVVLATCERLEVYAAGPGDLRGIDAALAATRVRRGPDAARHLFRVAAGLESRLTGETAILGQTSKAMAWAKEHDALDPLLAQLFRSAVRAGRRVRNETQLGCLASSYVERAVARVAYTYGGLAHLEVGVVGSGAVARELVLELRRRGARRITVVARHLERAAGNFRGDAAHVDLAPLTDLPATMPRLDAAITAVSSPAPILRVESIGTRSKGLLIVDLGMPPNTDEALLHVPGVRVDRLWDLDGSLALADRVRAQSEAIIDDELSTMIRRVAALGRSIPEPAGAVS